MTDSISSKLSAPLTIDQIDFRVQSINKFWAKVDKSGECWEWTASKRHKGYGQTRFMGRGGRKAHRVAWEITNGEIPNGLFVLHKCDNPGCVNPGHLFLGTNRSNIDDMLSKGRQGRKLTKEQATAIKIARKNGNTGVDVAREFDITPAQVSNIVTGKQWRSA